MSAHIASFSSLSGTQVLTLLQGEGYKDVKVSGGAKVRLPRAGNGACL
jgi:hypothetical protein